MYNVSFSQTSLNLESVVTMVILKTVGSVILEAASRRAMRSEKLYSFRRKSRVSHENMGLGRGGRW